MYSVTLTPEFIGIILPEWP